MKIEDEVKSLFNKLSRSQKVKFVSENIDYASDDSVIRHVGLYIFDILEDIWQEGEIDSLIYFLQQKGYKVEKENQKINEK